MPQVIQTRDNTVVTADEYLRALASFVRLHESKLADFSRRPPTASASLLPSWTAILTLGIISSSSPIPSSNRSPLVLKLDPHHLYFLLLKAEEAGVNGLGSLDVLIEGGPTRPMSINYGNTNLSIPGLTLGGGGGGGMVDGRDSDSMSLRSTFSAVSNFSLGSGWWGTSVPTPPPTANVDIKYIYSSMTKLPALKLTPFTFCTSTTGGSSIPTLSKPVQEFQDCPPPDTAVPLYAFKNLASLSLEDLDPRAFLGWDQLSSQLRSLELKRSGVEDLGELLCDAVVEDFERRKQGRRGGVGEERKRRQGSSIDGSNREDSSPPVLPSTDSITIEPSNGVTSINPSYYPVPPPSAWSRLVHLSLNSNSLTFIPSTPLLYLSALTSLDLSSNLLISIPTGLSSLHSLKALNLSDNMIDSLKGISKSLGNIQVINLSKNRLEILSGLDQLLALERIDLRENRLQESLEISRLARLPFLQEIWLELNPFSNPSVVEGGEEFYRVKCFDYFSKEGNDDIKLDGTSPGMTERRSLAAMREAEGRRNRSDTASVGMNRRASNPSVGGSRQKGNEEARSAGDAKVVGRRVVTAPLSKSKSSKQDLAPPPLPQSISSTSSLSDLAKPVPSSTSPPAHSPLKPQKKRKPRRIVDLDASPSSTPFPTPPSSSTGQPEVTTSDSDLTSSSSLRLKPITTTTILGFKYKSSQTEGRNSGLSTQQHHHNQQQKGSSLGPKNSNNGSKKPTRRERISNSTFEDPTSSSSPTEKTSEEIQENSADAFRKRVEALRNEVGENWLAVLGEREAQEEGKGKGKMKGKKAGEPGL